MDNLAWPLQITIATETDRKPCVHYDYIYTLGAGSRLPAKGGSRHPGSSEHAHVKVVIRSNECSDRAERQSWMTSSTSWKSCAPPGDKTKQRDDIVRCRRVAG